MPSPLAAILLALSLSTPSTDPPDSVTAFVNVSVIPMDREQVLTGQTVLVRGGHIVAIGAVDQVTVPADAVRVDGQGKFLIPGLADMHAHLPETDFWGEETVARAERALLADVASGLTAIRNMGGEPLHLQLREQATKGELVSPRIYTAGPKIAAISSPEEAKRIVAEQKAAGYDFIKLRMDGFPISQETLDTFVAAARRAGIPFAGHVPPSIGIKGVLRAGFASVEHLYGAIDMSSPEKTDTSIEDESKMPALAAAAKRAGVWHCPTLGVVEFITIATSTAKGRDPTKDWKPILFNRRSKYIKALHEAGAGLLLGTDGTGAEGITVQRELELLVLAGLTPYQALETSTRNVAAFWNMLDSTGTVAVGKRADLVLLQGNPLENISHSGQVAGVVLGGRWFPREVLDARLATMPKLADESSAGAEE